MNEYALTDTYEALYDVMTQKKKTGSDSRKFTKMKVSLENLVNEMRRLGAAGPDGKVPNVTPAQMQNLRKLQKEAFTRCDAYVKSRSVDSRWSNVGTVRASMAEKIRRELQRDLEGYSNADIDKGMNIYQVAEKSRATHEQIDLSGNQHTGANMSSRIKLKATENRPEGYFTPAASHKTLAEESGEIVQKMAEKYPQYEPLIRVMAKPRKNDITGRLSRFWCVDGGESINLSEQKRQQIAQECAGDWNKLKKNPETAAFAEHLEFLAGDEKMAREEGLPAGMNYKNLIGKPEFISAMLDVTNQVRKAVNRNGLLARTGIKEGRNLDKRNVAMSRITRMLGHGNLLAYSETMTLQDKSGEITGTFMANAKGHDIKNLNVDSAFYQPGMVFDTKEGRMQTASLQAIDYICGNTDRHNGNMLYDLGKDENGQPKLTGIQGIDNDNSFGVYYGDEYDRNSAGISAGVQLKDIRFIREEDVAPIMELTEENLSLQLFDLLAPDEIQAAWERTKTLQYAISKSITNKQKFSKKKPNGLFIVSDDQLASLDENSFPEKSVIKRPIKLQRQLDLNKQKELENDKLENMRENEMALTVQLENKTAYSIFGLQANSEAKMNALPDKRLTQFFVCSELCAECMNNLHNPHLKDIIRKNMMDVNYPKLSDEAKKLIHDPQSMKQRLAKNLLRLGNHILRTKDISDPSSEAHTDGQLLHMVLQEYPDLPLTEQEKKTLNATDYVMRTVLKSKTIRGDLWEQRNSSETFTETETKDMLRGLLVCEMHKRDIEAGRKPVVAQMAFRDGDPKKTDQHLDQITVNTEQYKELTQPGMQKKAAAAKMWMPGWLKRFGATFMKFFNKEKQKPDESVHKESASVAKKQELKSQQSKQIDRKSCATL